MMRAPPFRYVAARSVGEAVRALADNPGAMLLAGGTDLLPKMKRRQMTPPVLVSLRNVPHLSGVARSADGSITIGAATTLAELAGDGKLAAELPSLWRAAMQVATPQIRNAATIGGNLCVDTRCNYYDQSLQWREAIGFCMKAPGPDGVARSEPHGGRCWVALSSPKCKAASSSDGAPALIALGARLTLVSSAGERVIPLDELYADDGMEPLTKKSDEILVAVHLPQGASSLKSTYWKLSRRGSFDFPVLGVAAAVKLDPLGIVEEARVVLGAVASRPVVVPAAGALVGKPLTDEAIDGFAREASRFAKPLDNTDFELHWRKRVARAYLGGVLRELRGDDPANLSLLARRASAMRLSHE